MRQLRPYQQRALDTLRAHVAAGKRRILMVCPTGGGKTALAGAIVASARQFGNRVLFFAHRKELVEQPLAEFARWGVTECGVMRADDERTSRAAPVQIASVQTLARRDLPPADVVFVDEAHRAAGDTYRRILDAYPEAIIIGLTATPCRLDGKPLGDVFEVLEIAATYSELISDGHIVAPVVYSSLDQPDLSKVHTRNGDFAEDELVLEMLKPQVLGSIVSEWQKHAGGRRTVVYACTIEHSLEIVSRFLSAGIRAAHLDGATRLDERAAILARLESGALQVVSNCQVLTEGWDCPPVKCVQMARPTKSLTLYMQTVGRALRPWNGVRPVVIDHGGNVARHGMPHEDREWSLLTQANRKAERALYHVCPGCFAYVEKNPCELCGYTKEVTPRELRKDESVELVEMVPKDPRRAFFETAGAKARLRGFKPGYAAAQFKEKFGSWPPWSWGDELKRLYASDADWQDRLMRRERERDFWKDRDAALKASAELSRLVEAPEEAPGPVETPFADWVQEQLK